MRCTHIKSHSTTKKPINVQFLDVKVQKNLIRYIFQCSLATLTILAILLFLDVLTETALIASLGASAFVIFTMPTTYSSDPRRLLGGYGIGISIGVLFSYLTKSHLIELLSANNINSLVVFGAIAVGIAIFIMTITNTEHAPAAGIALGLVLNQWDFTTLIFIIVAIIWLTVVKKLLQPILIDLISPKKLQQPSQ